MTTINLFFRPSVKIGNHQGSLFMRLIQNRQVKTVTLPSCKLYSQEWNSITQEIIYPINNSHRFSQLDRLQTRINNEMEAMYNCIFTLEKQGHYTLDDLVMLYLNPANNDMLLGYSETLIFGLEKQDRIRTASAYRTVARGLIEFIGRDIPLRQINAQLIKEFEKHLKNKGIMLNTISYYMRNLRAIYNKAISDKRIIRRNESPFAGVYTGTTKTIKRALSVEEMNRMHQIDFAKLFKGKKPGSSEYISIENLYQAYLYFSFCFFMRGMSFIDMAYLRKDNIYGGIIRYIRKKTGQSIEVKVTPEIKTIINIFGPQVKDSSYVFPIIKNSSKKGYSPHIQYDTALRLQNHRLKLLASIAKIPKRMSTHVARHSWASIGKMKEIPVRIISECLGHTSEKTTQIYLDSLDNSILDAANRIIISAIPEFHTCENH